MEHKPKRKTHTSTAVKMRYIDKAYCRYLVNFRQVEDADIIAAIDTRITAGEKTTEVFRQLIRKALHQ